MRTLAPPPAQLVSEGRFNLGTFTGPVPALNMLDARIHGVPLPRTVKALRLKEWQAFQIGTERFFMIIALFDAKALAIAQLKIVDKETGQKTVFERRLPPWALRFPDGLLESTVNYEAAGVSIRFVNALAKDRFEIAFEIAGEAERPSISGEIVAHTGGVDHQVVCLPLSRGRAMYSHKGQFPAEGTLRVGSEEVRLGGPSDYVLVDDHRGFYPRVMTWDWVTAGGVDAEGRRMGFNLTRNQVLDPARFNENALWIDGRLHILPPVRFTRETTEKGEVWLIRDAYGRVDLRFEVKVAGRVDIDLLVIKSAYRGPFGYFTGKLVTQAGEGLEVPRLFGMGERFYLKC